MSPTAKKHYRKPGYFERFLYSTLIYFINCSTDINQAPYLGLYMGPSFFTFKKKLAPNISDFLNFMLRSKLPHDGATLNGFQILRLFLINCTKLVQRRDFFACLEGF